MIADNKGKEQQERLEPEAGDIRIEDTTGIKEFWTGLEWKEVTIAPRAVLRINARWNKTRYKYKRTNKTVY